MTPQRSIRATNQPLQEPNPAPCNRTQEEILVHHSSLRAIGLHWQSSASTLGVHRRGSCHAVSQRGIREARAKELAQHKELEHPKARTACG